MNTNPMQAMMDGMSQRWQQERATTQMTLGKLIDRLQELKMDMPIEGIDHPHSYRGYYSDLSFERSHVKTVGETLEMARKCMGEVFEGYKGGNYQMGRNTPLWIASYGDCGTRIMGLIDDGKFTTADEP